MNKTHLSIDLLALEANYKLIKSKVHSDVQVIGVVKANAYGSDAIVVARKLIELGVKHLAVAYTEEGVALREAHINLPILVFYPQIENFKTLIDHDLTPSIYSFSALDHFEKSVKKEQKSGYPIHIKVNTGMNRLGIEIDELKLLSDRLEKNGLLVSGVFSHFAASGSPNKRDFTQYQIGQFQQAVDFFKSYFSSGILFHLSNSSGILNFPDAGYNGVRAGIALYGYGNHPQENRQLQPVASLLSPIIQIREIEAGESVGYGRGFVAKKLCKIATLAIGYADGISRIYGNGKAIVNVNGKSAPTCGNICMDTLMVDVSGICCQEGEMVKIFGVDHPATDFDAYQQSIEYELITRISSRVPRCIKK
jgi:alanine racemase